MRINLGCGLDMLPGWVNVDASLGLPGTYEVWDLEELPWLSDALGVPVESG